MQKEQQQLAALVRGKKVAFIGAGVSHKTLIEEFVGLGAEVTLCDRKKSVEEFGAYADTIRRLGIRLSLGENYMDGFKGQDIILRTPGFEYYQKPLQDAIAAGTMVTSEVELFFDLCPCEIVAVTGSDGKTTTTTIIAELLKAAGKSVYVGGNIGRPLLPDVDGMEPGDIAVLELSSFQLMTMDQSPHIAVVTNISPNHLDYHHTMEEYRAQVHDQLAARKRTTAINHARNQILMQLADAAKGDLPEILVENAYHVEMQSVQQQLQMQRLSMDKYLGQIHQTRDEFKATVRKVAERNTRARMALLQIAGTEGLVPTDAELDQQLSKRAEMAKKTLEEVKEKTDLRALRRNESIRRAADWVIERSTVKEVQA